jgi:predicted signal transduction protein with EAL and GGDEF domain
LLAAIAVPHHIANQAVQVTASLGISLYPSDGADPGTLLQQADIALLRAKAQRNSSLPQHDGPGACVQVGASRQVS